MPKHIVMTPLEPAPGGLLGYGPEEPRMRPSEVRAMVLRLEIAADRLLAAAKVLGCVVFVFLVGIIVLGVLVSQFRDDQREAALAAKDGNTTVVSNQALGRALICINVEAQIGKANLPDGCRDPAVLAFYSPEDIQAILCTNSAALGFKIPACTEPG